MNQKNQQKNNGKIIPFVPKIAPSNAAKSFLNIHVPLLGPDGQPFEVPVSGAIGLLTLGDLGTIAWRQKRHAAKAELARRTQTHLASKP